MAITILVSKGPASRASLRSAELARALLRNGETIGRVFFHGDGVQLCHAGTDPQKDALGAANIWQTLIKDHQLPATACSGSVARRGLDQPTSRLADGVETAGLGQLASALQDCENLVSF
ncbi:MAG: DsrE family protein [Alcanivoracaceae bacterium]|nr:DsrE family protein [Alcanivoracaceae bacterium]